MSANASPGVNQTLDLLFRRRSAQLTATLVRVFGVDQLDLVEDVVQDAFIQALKRWPRSGIPDNPGAWVLRTAKNRAIDILRREARWAGRIQEIERSILPVAGDDGSNRHFFSHAVADDELRMIFAMCHPTLPLDAQIALTLKTVGGFGVNEIARAFLVSGSAIAQRLVRARRRLKTGCVLLAMPDTNELPERLDAVLEVLYLMFNEGHSAAAGDDLVRAELCAEAIRLAELVAIHPVVGRPRVDALCALFLFQAARIPARMASGELIPLPLQDRSVWDRRLMRRALTHQRRSARGEAVTSYHLQAEIAGCHTLAASYEATDWPRILDCYDTLLQIDNSPVIAINRVVALAEVHGPGAGIQALSDLKEEGSLDNYYHLYAVESELLRRLGHRAEASQALETAMRLVKTSPVRRYLATRALNHVGSTEP